ncbi:MAG: amidase [Candidatus Rokuibacteriota bacterium]|nr:MAG: amidase [Candidatus Rokubacteria bacterium]
MSRDDLAWKSALELATLIREKQVSPVEVTETVLARIDASAERLNAYCLVSPDTALTAAREAEIVVMKGEPLGLLHGVPVSVKDVIFTRALRTTGGSRLFAEMVPDQDAVAVARLRAAGAVVLGKTNTSEFGHKALTDNPLFGATRNPWNVELTPGGSSGGAAAAVAADLGPIALGTDGGGSIRIPAAFCGIVGFKPSYGRVPQSPGFPGWEGLSHTGPITRTVRDAALALDVLAGADDRDRESLPSESVPYREASEDDVKGLHVAWTPDLGYASVDPRVRQLCEDAAAEFESLRCYVEVVNPAWDDPEDAFVTLLAAQFHAAWSDRLPHAYKVMDRTLIKFLERGAAVSSREYFAARARADAIWQDVAAFLARFDLLLTPTVAVPPFPLGSRPPRQIDGRDVSVLGWMPFTFPFNLTGQPACSVPAGWTDDGLPVGLQIVGRRHADRVVLAAAAAFEAARPWSDRHPA